MSLEEVKLLKIGQLDDERGFYCNLMDGQKIIENKKFIDAKYSFSKAGTWRGFHYQEESYAQGKFVIVITGMIDDYVLNYKNKNVLKFRLINDQTGLWIPPGLAHGFFAKEDTHLLYMITDNLWNESVSKTISYKNFIDFNEDKIKYISKKDKDGIVL